MLRVPIRKFFFFFFFSFFGVYIGVPLFRETLMYKLRMGLGFRVLGFRV